MKVSLTSSVSNKYHTSKKNTTGLPQTAFKIEGATERANNKKKQVIPENATQNIKEAWSKLTQDEKFSISKSILISTFEANIRLDQDGRSYRIHSNSLEYVENIMNKKDFDMFNFIDSWIERKHKNMELFPAESDRILKDIDALTKFKNLLNPGIKK